MAFGKRSQIVLKASDTGRRVVSPRRQIAGTALAGLILGFGGVTAGTSFVQASERAGIFGFFEELFRGPAPVRQPIRASNTRKRYAALPDVARLPVAKPRAFTPRPIVLETPRPTRRAKPTTAAVAPAASAPFRAPPASTGLQTVCVRTCDGYLFPLGRLYSRSDLPVHAAACAAACPNAPTALFTLAKGATELDRAVSLKGQPYLASAWANVYRQKRVPNCNCQSPGVATTPLLINQDSTAQVGDVVATDDSAMVVTKLAQGQVVVNDYRVAAGLTRSRRRDIDRRIGAMQRDSNRYAFERSMRREAARNQRVRVAEARFTRIRTGNAVPGFSTGSEVAAGAQTFSPVRVVTQSPYEP